MINIHEYTRQHLVEQVMARHGCASPDPVTYRRVLNRMGLPALRRALIEPPDFPALSLTENAGVIASADKGHAPDSSRGVFSKTKTLESVLP